MTSIDIYELFCQMRRERVSSGTMEPIVVPSQGVKRHLILIWSQLGDFDTLEYAWWLQREKARWQERGICVSAIGIGDRSAGERFCQYTGFAPEMLSVDPTAEIHRQLGLYTGTTFKLPGLSPQSNAFVNLMLMCGGIGSKGTLAEVLRGYTGDRKAPQLIEAAEVIHAKPLPPLKGSFFNVAGGEGFQRPFELATIRLRNMVEVLSNWNSYVPDGTYLTQRGGTFLFDNSGKSIYEHRDRGILGFADDRSNPLSFLFADD